MKEIISQIIPTTIHHPAIGILYSVFFESGNHKLLYEETFYHQFEDYTSPKELVGRELDFTRIFFDEVEINHSY
jgi:hypothetical protein